MKVVFIPKLFFKCGETLNHLSDEERAARKAKQIKSDEEMARRLQKEEEMRAKKSQLSDEERAARKAKQIKSDEEMARRLQKEEESRIRQIKSDEAIARRLQAAENAKAQNNISDEQRARSQERNKLSDEQRAKLNAEENRINNSQNINIIVKDTNYQQQEELNELEKLKRKLAKLKLIQEKEKAKGNDTSKIDRKISEIEERINQLTKNIVNATIFSISLIGFFLAIFVLLRKLKYL